MRLRSQQHMAGEAPASGPVQASGGWWDRLGLSHTAGLQGAALGSSLSAPHLLTMLMAESASWLWWSQVCGEMWGGGLRWSLPRALTDAVSISPGSCHPSWGTLVSSSSISRKHISFLPPYFCSPYPLQSLGPAGAASNFPLPRFQILPSSTASLWPRLGEQRRIYSIWWRNFLGLVLWDWFLTSLGEATRHVLPGCAKKASKALSSFSGCFSGLCL